MLVLTPPQASSSSSPLSPSPSSQTPSSFSFHHLHPGCARWRMRRCYYHMRPCGQTRPWAATCTIPFITTCHSEYESYWQTVWGQSRQSNEPCGLMGAGRYQHMHGSNVPILFVPMRCRSQRVHRCVHQPHPLRRNVIYYTLALQGSLLVQCDWPFTPPFPSLPST